MAEDLLSSNRGSKRTRTINSFFQTKPKDSRAAKKAKITNESNMDKRDNKQRDEKITEAPPLSPPIANEKDNEEKEQQKGIAENSTTKVVSKFTLDQAITKNSKTREEILADLAITDDQRQEYRLEYETIDSTWLRYLITEISKPYFANLKKFLKAEEMSGKSIFPPAIDVYSWSRFTPLPEVRVVILGQDPYHGPGQAHGLAFSVKPNVRVPPSLVNMYKALAIEFPNSFKQPSHGFLKGWAVQGVLMLNASLTVECHKANSHANRGWEQFTDAVIKCVNDKCNNVVFLLWGSYAQKKGAALDKSKHLVLKTVHPSPLSARRGFFEAGHFKKTNEYLKKHGRKEIDWSCLPLS